MPAETKVQRAEEQRDLKSQITAGQNLDRQEESGIIFKETSPARVKTTIWHMRNGQPAEVPEYIAIKALNKIDPDTGTYMFTATQSNAPEYKPGTVLCFMHKDAPDQVALEELGLTTFPCKKHNLGNQHSKRMHAIHKHHDEWEAYQALMDDRKEQRADERSQAQVDAMLLVAEKAAGGAPVQPVRQSATAVAEKPNVRICNNCKAEIEGKLADHTC